jgi:hypothetical protein
MVGRAQKPGFSPKSGGDAKIVAETRFLGFGGDVWGLRNRVSLQNLVGCQNCRRNPVSWTRRVEIQKPYSNLTNRQNIRVIL